MNRLSMVWIVPTVAGFVALSVSGLVCAQTTSDVEKKWNVSEPDLVVAQAETGEPTAPEPTDEKPSQNQGEQPASSELAAEPLSEIVESPAEGQETQDASESTDDFSRSDADDPEAVREEALANQAELSSDSLWSGNGPRPQSEEQQTQADKLATAQRRYNLEQQFAKLRKTLEYADAYSLELAEDYYSYGLSLRENGQYDEALEAFVDALHIQKVNHGIYAPEQRPALKALFETHYALGNVEDFEDYLERILWVESKNPNLEDDFSYKMLVTVGNRYIDQFLKRPIAGQSSVQTLLRAKHHLNAAFKRHKDKPLTVALMPYGELALISFLESQLLDDVDKTASMEDPRLRGSRNLDGRELALASYLSNSFPRGTGLLRSYLKKAQTEENLPHVVRALVALGDFNQLFRRNGEAAEYYKLAWRQAQNLPADHAARELLGTAVPLPAFQYAQDRDIILPTKPTIMIPLVLDIGPDGRVNNVVKGDEQERTAKYFSRARRLARRTPFRPKVIDGEPEAISGLIHEQRVYARRGS